MTRILMIEPDLSLARRITASLARDDLTVEHAATAREALHRVMDGGYALVTVTHDLADVDGPALVAALRATGVALPILALDPHGSIERCVHMLKAGADDYQPFPLDFDELGARVQALLRRRGRVSPPGAPGDATQLQAPGIVLDRIRRVVVVDATPVLLRPTEFRLLEFLMRNPERVVTRRMILEAVWQHYFDPGTNLIEVHVKQLRKKIHDPEGKRFIRTVRRAGYYFSGDTAPDAAAPDDAAADSPRRRAGPIERSVSA